MPSRFLLLVSATILLGACAEPSAPRVSRLEIQGTVMEQFATSVPVPDAEVTVDVLTATGAGATASDSTDAAGAFALEVEVPGGCDGADSLSVEYRAEAADFRAIQGEADSAVAWLRCGTDPQMLHIELYREIFRSPEAVAGSLDVRQLSAGVEHACVVATDGAYCWGDGRYDRGVLGNAAWDGKVAPAPVAVTGGGAFTSVSAAWDHTCALDGDGVAWCWGGVDPDTVVVAEPVRVATDLRFVQISAGYLHTCGLTADGAVYCWGTRGSLGIGPDSTLSEWDQIYSEVPTPTRSLLDGRFVQLSGAKRWHACALRDTGDLFCWGFTHGDELGGAEGPGDHYVLTPVQVPGDGTWAMVDAGDLFTCGLTTAGAAYCWGRDYHGRLGRGIDGSGEDVAPTAVVGGHVFAGITAGRWHACAWTATGDVYCWGDNGTGAVGAPAADSIVLEPTRVATDLAFTSVDAGQGFTCGIAAGKAYCWGKRNALGSGRPIP
jgi:alpha-tubulin suppressor-like RCC1 family protein